MADELDTDNSILESQTTTSMRDLVDAMRVLTESNVELSNKLTDVVDAQMKPQVNIVANRPKTARKSMNVLSDRLEKLFSSKAAIGRDNTSQLNVSLSKLNINLESLQSGIQRVLKRMEESAHFQNAAYRRSRQSKKTDSNKNISTDKKKEEEIYNDLYSHSAYTRHFNKYTRLNPVIRSLMPRVTSFGGKLASSGDVLSNIGGPLSRKLGSVIGRLGVGVAAGNLLSIGTVAAITTAIEGFNRWRKAFAQSYLVEQRIGESRPAKWGQSTLYNRLALTGMSYDDALKQELSYIKAGVTDEKAIVSGTVAEKVFGVEGMPAFAAMLIRRTDAMASTGGDLARVFQTLKPLVKDTGLSINELQTGITELTSGIRGAGFSVSGLGAIEQAYGGMVARKQLSWGDVSSIYGAHQNMDTNKLLTYTYFAQQAGYKGDMGLLGAAYSIRHMKGGDTDEAARLRQAATRGLYQQLFGKNSWAELTRDERFIASEQILPEAFDFDVAKKMPEEIDNLMSLIDKGVSFADIPSELRTKMEDARKTDTERIANIVAGIQNPVEQIRNILFQTIADPYEGWKAARRFVSEDKEFKDSFNKMTETKANIYVTNASRYSDLEFGASPVAGVSGKVSKVSPTTQI